MYADFLAQFFGLYFVLVGLLVMLNNRSLMGAVSDLMSNRALMMLVGLLEIAAGLGLVIAHPNITADMEGAIALIGWIMLAEGVIYLLLPRKEVQKIVKKFNTKFWYVAGGLFAVVFGAYLAASGFGLLM